jgi:hypothetical protein
MHQVLLYWASPASASFVAKGTLLFLSLSSTLLNFDLIGKYCIRVAGDSIGKDCIGATLHMFKSIAYL